MTQRKRATGFALMDTAFTSDAKFVRLARKATSPTEFAAAVGVFWLILADARRARDPGVNWEDYTEYADQIAALQDARLLTDSGFDAVTFERWAPAYKAPNERTRPSPTVPNGTGGTPTSTHINSSRNGEGGVGGEEPGIWNGQGTHDGRHGYSCSVCLPLLPPRPQIIEGGKGA